ncbi:MAG: GNAT family N-acetyltransferase [Paracoccaceae bacterium]
MTGCGAPPVHRSALGQPVGAPLEVELPRPAPPRMPMAGRDCRLEPADPAAHAKALHAAFATDTEGRGWTYLPYGPFGGTSDFHAWMEAACTGNDPQFFTIFDKDGPAGLASFLRIAPDLGRIELGHIHMSPRLSGTRAATEAMYLMARRVFDELGYRRYEWKCDALNAASRRAAERLGFTFEGTFRKATHYKGRNRDTAWFAMLNDDWPARRAALEAWLDPSNFDADGRQRARLARRG